MGISCVKWQGVTSSFLNTGTSPVIFARHASLLGSTAVVVVVVIIPFITFAFVLWQFSEILWCSLVAGLLSVHRCIWKNTSMTLFSDKGRSFHIMKTCLSLSPSPFTLLRMSLTSSPPAGRPRPLPSSASPQESASFHKEGDGVRRERTLLRSL